MGEVQPETFSVLIIIVDFGGEMVKMIEKHIANCFSKLIKIHNLFLERVSWRLVSNLGAESQELVHLCIFT